MFYALASEIQESFFADNVNAFIALAPCMIAEGFLLTAFPEGRQSAVEWLDARPNLAKDFPLNNIPSENDAFCAAVGEASGACNQARFVSATDLGHADQNSLNQFTINWSQDRF